MKKFIFLLAITFLASFNFLSAQNFVLNQDATSVQASILKHNVSRADGILSYINDADLHWVVGNTFPNANTYYMSGCINFTAAQMTNYVGGQITKISVAIPTEAQLPGVTSAKVWIRGSLTGAILYEQPFTVVQGDYNDVILTTPYVIPTGTIAFGYTLTVAVAANATVRPFWCSDPAENPYQPGGFNYIMSTSPTSTSWNQFTAQGNIGIKGYCTGITTPPVNDLAASLLKATNDLKILGTQYAYTVTVFNAGTAAQNNYTVQLIDGADNVLASKAVTTNLASGASNSVSINFAPPTAGSLVIKGKVVLTGDEVAGNNVTEAITNITYPMQPMGYCTLANDNAYGATNHPNAHHAAIGYLAADIGGFVGKKLTAFDVCLPIEPSNLTNCSIWIRNSTTGTNLYTQPFTPTVKGWNRIVLTTPYVIQNANTFIGYTVNTVSSESCYPLSYSANTPGNANGGHFAIASTWYTLQQQGKVGNMNIVGAVDGACDPATNLEVSYNANCHAVITWTAPAGATNFNIYRDGVSIAQNISTTTYTDQDFNPSQSHAWSVTVACSGGGESSPILKTLAACIAPPEPVTNLEVNYNTNCKAVLTWTASVTATHYKILRGTAVIAENVVATSYTDEESNPVQGYTWAVVACNVAGESAPANKAKAACITPPPAVTNFDVKYETDCSAAKLTWTATTAEVAKGYNVYRGTDLIATVELLPEPFYVDAEYDNSGSTVWSVKIKCDFGIESAPAAKTLGICLGIKENVKTFSIAPNPASNNVTITASNNFHTIEVLSFLGQVVLSQPNNGTTAEMDISTLTNGVYFVRIISENGTSVQKFVKQ